MACFCKDTVSMLALTLPSLSVSASLSASLSLSAAAQIGAMARLMMNLGVNFNPDPAWLQIQFPTISLSASAMATLSAFAQLQAMAGLLGLNLTTSLGVSAFAELATSVAARLSAILSLGLTFNPGPWAQMSAALTACAQIQAALKLNLFAPMNINVSLWANFLAQLQLILPMLSIIAQLGLNVTGNISAQLSLILKLMLGIPMPQLPPMALTMMASLTSTLTAIAQIKLSLGIDPLAIGLPAVHLMVQERIQATISMVESLLGMSFSAALQFLAKLQLGPTLIATPLNIRLAANLALPPINWSIPAMGSLPVLSLGLPIAALMAQLKAALNMNLALSTCMAGCDMKALGF
jgi:hypothetical protein